MASRFPASIVALHGSVISIAGPLGHTQFHRLAEIIQATGGESQAELTIDFTDTTTAFPECMVPLAALVSHERARGRRFHVRLPAGSRLATLFLNANWAHLLAPAQYSESTVPFLNHLRTFNFRDYAEQGAVVTRLLDIVFRTLRLPKSLQDALDWSISEITENVLTHSGSPLGGFVQATSWRDSIQFTVSDAGRGVYASLREAYPVVTDETEAVYYAAQTGVTGRPATNAGNGLAGSKFLAMDSGGYFGITSGMGNYFVSSLHGTESSEILEEIPEGERAPGTTVTVRLGTRSDFSAGESIGRLGATNHEFFSHLDAVFDSRGDGRLSIDVSTSVSECRSRHTGRELARLVENALERADQGPVQLDWQGAQTPTSSFADEALGKMAELMGEEEFSKRIRLTGLDSTGESVVSAAISSRLSRRLNAKSTH